MIHAIAFRAMGCEVHVQLESDEADAVEVLQHVVDDMASYEATLTRFNPNSELMQLNRQAGAWVKVSSVLFDNIHAAKHAARLTSGYYNPLVGGALAALGYNASFEKLIPQPSQTVNVVDWRGIQLDMDSQMVRLPEGATLDLGGIAKGWATEKIADKLAQYGACLVNIGGDMTGRGKPNGYDGWPIQLDDPFNNAPFTHITLYNRSIATSGIDYRHWLDSNGHTHHHIINPNTGQSAQTDVVSVSVIHHRASTAEAFAKAVLLQGATEGMNWLHQQWDGEGLVFGQDGAVLATSFFTHTI